MVTYRTVWSPWPRCLSRAGIAGDSTDQSWDLIPLEPGGPGKSGRKAYASAVPRRWPRASPRPLGSLLLLTWAQDPC